MEIAADGNFNPDGTSMLDPIGESAPMDNGKVIIIPIAASCSTAMLPDEFGGLKAALNADL